MFYEFKTSLPLSKNFGVLHIFPEICLKKMSIRISSKNGPLAAPEFENFFFFAVTAESQTP